MRFYVVMTLLVVVMVAGYHLTETYRRLDDFHRRYLEGGPRVSTHAEPAESESSR